MGISRPAVSKALRLGTLKLAAGGANHNDEKMIDVDNVKTKAYIAKRERKMGKKLGNVKIQKKTEKNKKKGGKNESEVKTQKNVKAQNKKNDSAPKHYNESEQPGDDDENLGNAFDKIRLECEKKKREIAKLDIDNGKKRGELVERKMSRIVFMKIYNIDVNQYLQLKDILTGKIASILGITNSKQKLKITQTIDKELYKTQNYIKREIDKYLDGIEKMGMVEE